ncbi:3-hydroxyacyl-[acyl-carrier-protein] dehydratase [Paenimyroides aquimaris]|uniref:3-hydroxyacyl-[acyl-carrier-protein] dehydratase n=1 Tax=Paenimyroides marinum TaxID=1159016 RepID=A0A1H6LYL6_9FLAO|nr:3-hydroxyacyl-ACP dehydratase [Paenimyroides aquimaris]SEH90669.1 3-hydroxyacyl-[acyl-carrier-protein] dehydratase [Paenimyroides aquimaris]
MLTDFYQTERYQLHEGVLNATVKLNPQHDIFKGHFPNNPVMPGVCMLQIFKELSEQGLNKKLFIKECSNVKFMALINPETHSVLDIVIGISETEEGFKIKASATFDTITALKVSALLREQL